MHEVRQISHKSQFERWYLIVNDKSSFNKDFTQWLGTYRIDQKEQHSQKRGAVLKGPRMRAGFPAKSSEKALKHISIQYTQTTLLLTTFDFLLPTFTQPDETVPCHQPPGGSRESLNLFSVYIHLLKNLFSIQVC